MKIATIKNVKEVLPEVSNTWAADRIKLVRCAQT